MELIRNRNIQVRLLTKCISSLSSKCQHRCHFTHEHLRLSKIFPNIAHIPPELTASSKGDGGQTVCKSQRLMTQCKLLYGGAPGTFTMSPFMTRAIEKLHRLIDWEMQSLGAQKIAMPCVASGQLWKSSKRWHLMGSELFTFQDRQGKDICLAPTHEEAVTTFVAADKDVPPNKLSLRLYQIGRKFRDEMRPKHGLLRCREFEMKDLYTFDTDKNAAISTYEEVCASYDKLFNSKLELNALKVEASSASMKGSKSHEYHVIADIGEDTLLKCDKCGRSINQELTDFSPDITACNRDGCPKTLNELTGIEIAHAFYLGCEYSKLYKANTYNSDLAKHVPLEMGCFGIGVTRVLAAAAELLSTEEELRWPRLLAPHQVCIVPQKSGYYFTETLDMAVSLHKDLLCRPNLVNEVLLDDRHGQSIGKRVRAARQVGIPHVVALGKKVQESRPLFEYIDVYNDETHYVTREELLDRLSQLETVVL